jgi:very-short-patch-repair endonuclease
LWTDWRNELELRHAGAVLEETLERQAGVVARWQALDAGLSRKAIEVRLRTGRWRRLHPGVYATFTGIPGRQAQLWAAVLHCGSGAALSHESAAELCGLVDETAHPIHVSVSSRRKVSAPTPLVVHHVARVRAHPSRQPPQTAIDDIVIDLTQAATSLDQAIAWIARACARRLTTPARLGRALAARPKIRWRRELADACADVAEGCHSLLEWRYLREVERAHCLPRGRRQVARQMGAHRARRYDDVRYEEYAVVVELDGRVAHPTDQAFRDMRRDNALVVAGERVLRYGWSDVAPHPCAVAAQAAAVLQAAGWRGAPRRCGRPDCVIVELGAPYRGLKFGDHEGGRGSRQVTTVPPSSPERTVIWPP